ncbi:helix-turn-helix domain-containing protein [Thalassotalea piscium]
MRDDSLLNQLSAVQLIEAFELLPDILFWIKDLDCKIVYANKYLVEHLGYRSLENIIGKGDSDFSPPYLAKQYIVDDQKVLAGEIVQNRLEMNVHKSREVAWFSTSKRPLRDEHNRIIGSYGITRHLEKTVKTLSGIDVLKVPVDFIRLNYERELHIEELAEVSHLSVSALERRFKKYLNKTPKQFIREIRLEKARQLLIETTLPIAEIAFQCGYADHSYFSKHFKGMFEQLPSSIRGSVKVA